MKELKDGLFITVEGGEGAGKTTVIEYLDKKLSAAGYRVLRVREPGGTKAAESIRDCILTNFEELGPVPQLFLYSAARYCDTRDNIIPALRKGYIVLCDRYCLSTIIYQGLLGNINMRDVTEVNRMATQGLKPDLEILLDIDAEIGLKRALSRSEVNSIDKLPIQFHRNVNNLYKHHTYSKRRVILDASQDVDKVCELALQSCNIILPEPEPISNV